MYSLKQIYFLEVEIEPKNSGTRVFIDNSLFDINELHKILNEGNLVAFVNNVSNWSDATDKQYFILTDKVKPAQGYKDAYSFSHYGRSNSGAVNRKIIMNFDDTTMMAQYFGS